MVMDLARIFIRQQIADHVEMIVLIMGDVVHLVIMIIQDHIVVLEQVVVVLGTTAELVLVLRGRYIVHVLVEAMSIVLVIVVAGFTRVVRVLAVIHVQMMLAQMFVAAMILYVTGMGIVKVGKIQLVQIVQVGVVNHVLQILVVQ